MKGRTYAFMILVALSALAGNWAIDRVASSADFRLVLSPKKVPPALLEAAFGGTGGVAAAGEPWNPTELADAARPPILPRARFLLAREYADGRWEMEWQAGGQALMEMLSVWERKDGLWTRTAEGPNPSRLASPEAVEAGVD